ncbi:molybdopterin-dependent oxidoreductase [Pontibacter actiniarum]|uniref:Oxidoreductase n=1 Tax=Pontibacter actiniarum TaxID=323450 RepID=A0A1X9YRF8_9BACT|nr:molybdopterin-dependent oxidoreductase [Pontibacter actiniarum]ARS35421.1 hypothetical protein CA264_08200 [Pontibacter actiniarum]
METQALDFPLWLRVTHFFNFLFMTLLVRSGIEIIGAHPMFYWNNDCEPGSEWLNFLNKKVERNTLWTAEDEIRPLSPWLALPGRNNLGLGRHWHLWSVVGWLLSGILYMTLLFLTPHWQRLVPTSWSIFPEAWQAFKTYLSLELPAAGNPYNPLQQLTYFLLVFALTPLVILTGILMAPAISARYPKLTAFLGGRQVARSIHLLGLVAYVFFFLIHLFMVVAHGLEHKLANMVLNNEYDTNHLALAIGFAAIALVIGLNIFATKVSLKHPFQTKKALEVGIDSLRRFFFHHQHSVQDHQKISPTPRANGQPPRNTAYTRHLAEEFKNFTFEVRGLVEKPLDLRLDQLKALPKQEQSTLHVCVQGWSYYATWGGVRIENLLALCKPLPDAKYLVFHTLDEKWEKPEVDGYYYEVIDMELARKPQTILAYEMNGAPLPIAHGAPLRLRLESQLGYKMAKYVCGVELVEDFSHIGKGQGGWRDDVLNYYVKTAGI